MVRSPSGVPIANAALFTTPVKLLVQALNASALNGGVQADPAVLQYHHQEWHRMYQAAMGQAKERENKGMRGDHEFVTSRTGMQLRTHAVWPHEKTRLGRRTWCVGCSHGRSRKGASSMCSMCTLCRVPVWDTCWDGLHSRVDFFASDVAAAQGPEGVLAGAAQPAAGAAQPAAGAVRPNAGAVQPGAGAAGTAGGSVPLSWDEEQED